MRRSVWLVAGLGFGAVVVASAIATGCSSNSGGALAPMPGGKTDAGGGGTDGGGHSDSSVQGTGGDGATSMQPATDSGTVTNPATLYGRLGGHAGIRAAVNAITAQEILDPDIASYFVFQAGAPANDHPTVDQIEECFTDYIGSLKAVGGPETYPTTVTADGGMFACRDMMAIHAPFNITGGTFDKFIAIAGEVLQENGVSNADLMTLASALESTKMQVAGATVYDAGEAPYDAGTE
jgi:hypothetical protein